MISYSESIWGSKYVLWSSKFFSFDMEVELMITKPVVLLIFLTLFWIVYDVCEFFNLKHSRRYILLEIISVNHLAVVTTRTYDMKIRLQKNRICWVLSKFESKRDQDILVAPKSGVLPSSLGWWTRYIVSSASKFLENSWEIENQHIKGRPNVWSPRNRILIPNKHHKLEKYDMK